MGFRVNLTKCEMVLLGSVPKVSNNFEPSQTLPVKPGSLVTWHIDRSGSSIGSDVHMSQSKPIKLNEF